MYALIIIPVLIILFIFGYFNSNKKIEQLIELSDQGNKRAEDNLLKLLDDGLSEKRYNKICKKHYFKKANDGDMLSQYMMGKLFSNSKDEALTWLTKSAENGNIDAIRTIAFGYSHEANQENPNSILSFGTDNEQSIEWYKKASAVGDNLSMYKLALFYFNDKENVNSLEEAINWFIRAAENGYVDAYVNLGEIYSNKANTDQYNIDKAIDMFYHAIDYGLKPTYIKAVYNIGLIYNDVDNTKAAYCFYLGTALGDYESERMFTLLNHEIDEDTKLKWENDAQSLWFNKYLY